MRPLGVLWTACIFNDVLWGWISAGNLLIKTGRKLLCFQLTHRVKVHKVYSLLFMCY